MGTVKYIVERGDRELDMLKFVKRRQAAAILSSGKGVLAAKLGQIGGSQDSAMEADDNYPSTLSVKRILSNAGSTLSTGRN